MFQNVAAEIFTKQIVSVKPSKTTNNDYIDVGFQGSSGKFKYTDPKWNAALPNGQWNEDQYLMFVKWAAHDKTYNKTYVTSEDSDQTVHPPGMARVLVHPSLDRPKADPSLCQMELSKAVY